jgi:hypothetical protein
MRTLKTRAIAILTVGVWTAAVGSAAALTYDLNRPLKWKGETPELSSPTGEASPQPVTVAPVATAPSAAQEETVLQVPTITIVGRPPPRSVAAPAPTTRDISEMRCAEWRDLDMGSGHVQVCE